MNTSDTLNGREIELFRVGDYSKIGKGVYTPADMQGLVERYSAAGESPIAIGHPKTDREPAFGWMKSLRFDGSVLHGTPGDVHQVLDDGYRQKMYRNRSVSFAKDPQGQLYLHHVAMLGAVPPIVQGLRDAQFSTNEYDEITFSDSGDNMPDQDAVKKTVLETLREFFSAKEASAAVPDVKAITDQVTANLKAEFSAQLAAEKAAREAVEARLADHQKTFSASGATSRVAGVIADLKSSGAWVPAYDKLGVKELFSALAAQAETVTFSDAANKEVKLDLVDALAATLKSVGMIVPRGQVFSASTNDGSKHSATVAEVNGTAVDADSVTFSAMIDELVAKEGIPYTEAYKRLRQQGKRPASGSSAAGAV